jgi:ribosomal protein L33
MWNFIDLNTDKPPEIICRENTVYNVLQSNPNFSIWKRIVDRSGMAEQMNERELNSTLFICSDDKLRNAPKGFFEKMDNGMCRQVLKASLMDKIIDRDLLTSSPVSYYYTKNPDMRMYITCISNRVMVNNRLTFEKYDIKCSNGMIHILDGIIIPTLDNFMN